MVAIAPIPGNEAERLETLHSYRILDSASDQRFDLFTRLGTWIYGVPISAINLVDSERTFFKSLIGFRAYEPRRATSICAHAVAGNEPVMVVEDLGADSRFQDHPLLLVKGIRFYAGAILHSPSGHRLGTLCICDQQPRAFGDEERQKLIELSEGVGAVLELHRSSLWLLNAASQDALTGLCNRRLFMERLEAAVARADESEPCVLLCLDLDRFKHVNDTLGHAAGDALLCAVAQRITETVRASDLVSRLGGDEFAVLLNAPATLDHAVHLAQRILDAFWQPYDFEGTVVPIRSSVGIAICRSSDTKAAALMRHADTALYQAKHSGRSRYCVYGADDAVFLQGLVLPDGA